MKSERFNPNPPQRSASDAAMQTQWKWTRIPEPGFVSDSKGSRRKIFAVISRPARVAVRGKTIRRVLIFDNHPETLRLLFNSGSHLDGDEAEARLEKRKSIISGAILIAMVVAALLWPLLS